jgi:putative transcriptional regulator
MTTKKASARRSASSKATSGKRTRLGLTIAKSLREAAAHFRGELRLHEYTINVPKKVDVAEVRGSLGLSQAAFADRFGLDVTAVQAWEQGRRQPDRAARILLAVIAREPEAVLRALSAGS